jgi:hypothetical protein
MKQVLALAAGMLAAAVIAQAAMAGNDGKFTLGPSGYDLKGKSALVVAGTANVVLGHDDRVVICRAARPGWEQHARPAEHAVEGKDAAGDIVFPFVVVSKKGETDTSLAAGQSWTAANAALYANSCNAPSSTPAPPPAAAPTQTVPATTVVIEKLVVQIKTTPAKKAVKKAKKAKKHAVKKHKAKKHRKINRAREARDTGSVPHRR